MTIRWPPLFNHQVYPPRLQAEMLALGARVSRPHLGMIVATLVLVTCLGQVPAGWLWTWYGFAFLTSAGGFLFRRRFWHVDQGEASQDLLRRGEWLGLLYSAAVGLVWGLCGQFMLPGQPEHNVLLTIVYLGVGAGAGSIAIFGPAHMLAGAILSSVLFVSRFPDVFPSQWGLLTVLFLLYHFVIVRMALERRQVLAQNMRLRAEKDSLLEQQTLEVARTRQASLDKSAFLAAASHDLRQPVHAVMLLGHALRMRVNDGESGDLVEKILEAGRALSEQFNNLMDLSRLEGGAYRLHFTWLPLEDWLRKTVGAHRDAADQQGRYLRWRVDRRLRGQAVYTDAGLLARVLDNLLVNAIKFSDPGSPILLTARLRGGRLLLGVHDRGRGIPAEQHEQVFKPYVQLDNPTRDRAKGIGLGLSIVREAAGLLGGQLSLKSVPGHGSHFSLWLPADSLRPLDLPADDAAPPPVPGGLLQGRRLLLVEDDPMAAQALVAWARGRGLVVEHHARPDTVTAESRPELILCDIRLPGERDGIDWLSQWLEDWPQARGLLVSGELSPETHDRAEQEGLLLLSKPVDPDLLLQTLTGLLR